MKIILIGLGAVGQGFLTLLDSERTALFDSYGLRIRIVAALDTSGAVIQPAGVDPAVLLGAKRRQDGLASAGPGFSPGRRALDVIDAVETDAVVEVTPTHILDGEPGLSHVRAALKAGRHVVTANKGPPALAMDALVALAADHKVELRFSGAVGGGTPMLDLARLGLRGERITEITGILNGTTNYILTRMTEGLEFEPALADAQRLGYAEADPALDVDGMDAAIKLTILANWTMGAHLHLTDVRVRGIRGVTRADLDHARSQGKVVKLLCRYDGTFASVEPELIAQFDPLNVGGSLNAVTYVAQHVGAVTLVGPGAGGIPTAATLLRDLIDIHLREK